MPQPRTIAQQDALTKIEADKTFDLSSINSYNKNSEKLAALQ